MFITNYITFITITPLLRFTTMPLVPEIFDNILSLAVKRTIYYG
jgi:hypothetical protein